MRSTGPAAILLFDVDGTLVHTGGAGRVALERAFDQLYGRADACNHLSFGGMTDRAIFREGLQTLGHDVTEEALTRLVDHYLVHLEDTVRDAPRYRVLSGVVELLDLVCPDDRFLVGLGTGNVVRGARIKLERGGLWCRFSFGGFGSDHETRSKLLIAGADRGKALLSPGSSARVIVIGDTPKDVSAAREAGFEVIAVASSGFNVAQLVATEPDLVVEDLRDGRVLEYLREEP